MHELILGGCKSGKSRCAQQRAADWLAWPGRSACVIVTALAADEEMRLRIARHREDRARELPAVQTLEVPRDLPEALRACSSEQRLVVVDCLTLWLTNLLMPMERGEMELRVPTAQGSMDAPGAPAQRSTDPLDQSEQSAMDAARSGELDERQWQACQDDLIDALVGARGPVVLVSNEIGWGVSPMSAPARRFVDALGLLHQRAAQVCGHVTLMVAGQELVVKGRR